MFTDSDLDQLNKHNLYVFALDCAEHALTVFEEGFPNDTRPRKGIDCARDMAAGPYTQEFKHDEDVRKHELVDADRARHGAQSAANGERAGSKFSRSTACSAMAVVNLLMAWPVSRARCASAIDMAQLAYQMRWDGWSLEAERTWQRDRFAEYLARQEVTV